MTDCFISKIKDNDVIAWDSYAITQTVCVNIAFQATMMYQNGVSFQEARAPIDKQYEEGLVKPTDIPMPAM
ncbi:PCYCGC motif-containing (lipo)protein [Bacillus sp. CGMCC 1.60114]|uniref:PCYCGC motif-containing (lipo)protein n=1 Tax=unclassified Bacillus (in: firmicutes) TaxID=185979 RepID=UPI00362BCFC8